MPVQVTYMKVWNEFFFFQNLHCMAVYTYFCLPKQYMWLPRLLPKIWMGKVHVLISLIQITGNSVFPLWEKCSLPHFLFISLWKFLPFLGFFPSCCSISSNCLFNIMLTLTPNRVPHFAKDTLLAKIRDATSMSSCNGSFQHIFALPCTMFSAETINRLVETPHARLRNILFKVEIKLICHTFTHFKYHSVQFFFFMQCMGCDVGLL